MNTDKGILGTLFDFSFSEFITIKVVKILFIIGLVTSGWWTVKVIQGVWWDSTFWGVITVLISPIIFAMFVLLVRVALELVLVLFRIAEGVKELNAKKAATDAPSSPIQAEELEVEVVDPPEAL
ncbi:MAG: DUF4282 domain-containing protein [bacterium]|nr:DUF4282 domain-containing protein [bacterium]